MKDTKRERILQILEELDKIKGELNGFKQELELMQRDTEEKKWAKSREINSLPEDLQRTPENILAIHDLLSLERKFKKVSSCFFHINFNIRKLSIVLKELMY